MKTERDPTAVGQELEHERWELLRLLEANLERPMILLGLVWLALLVVELVGGLTPVLEIVGLAIWIVFVLDFGLRLLLAPGKLAYLRGNWLTAIALVVPALRVFRIVRAVRVLRAARAARSLRLLRVVTSLNRGLKALGRAMGRRGFGYVAAVSVLVTLGGAAGMYAFEHEAPGGLESYGEALWWTAMLLTSIASEYWPQTPEGRALCFVLALYGFGIFGYVTATLASFFIGRDADADEAELAGQRAVNTLREEASLLRREVAALRDQIRSLPDGRNGSS